MSSSSGGTIRPAGPNLNVGKSKLTTSNSQDSDTEWTIAGQKKKRKSNSITSPNTTSKSKSRVISNSKFDFNTNLSSSSTNLDKPVGNINIDLSINDNITINDKLDCSDPNSIVIKNTNAYNIDPHLLQFNDNYTGIPMIIVNNINSSSSANKSNPLLAARFFSSNFSGVINVKLASHNKTKITFDSIINANICLKSDILEKKGFSASIPSTLIFSFGIIKLDISVPEQDFWEGVKSPIPILSFKRIFVKKDGKSTPTRLVELKFLASKIPDQLSIFNMLFNIKPSIRSPVQCNKCLRYGHTSKFCRSNPRCSHCGENNHSIDQCTTVNATDPCCLFCKLPHLATDRKCREWIFQQDIKKLMASENLSFRDALNFKKNNYFSPSISYSNVVSHERSDLPVHSDIKPSTTFTTNDTNDNKSFPGVESSFIKNNKKRSRHRSPTRIVTQNKFPNIHNPNFSLPNGSFLNYVSSNNDTPNDLMPPDPSWIHTFSHKLSESLICSPLFSNTSSLNSLQPLIESSLLNLFATFNNSLDSS